MQITIKTLYKAIYSFSIIGLQQFSLPFLSYFLIFIFSFKKISLKLRSRFFVYSSLIVFSSLFFLLAKGLPLVFSLNLCRFYFGSILLGLLLYKSCNIQKIYFIYAFLIWCLVEALSIFVTGSPPFYLINYFSENSAINLLDRANIGSSFGLSLRITGPTLNPSITGVYSAIILNLAIFDTGFLFEGFTNLSDQLKRLLKRLTIFFSFVVLVLTFSGSALLTFALLFLLRSRKYIVNLFLKFFQLRIKKASFYLIIGLFIFVIIQIIFYFIDPLFVRKIGFRYIDTIFQIKWNFIRDNFNSIWTYLFGSFYDPLNALNFWGGDLQLISFIYTFGFIYFIPMIFIAFRLSNRLKIYTFVLIISSLHYGTFFFVTGQILFAHLLVSSTYSISENKTNLIQSNLKPYR